MKFYSSSSFTIFSPKRLALKQIINIFQNTTSNDPAIYFEPVLYCRGRAGVMVEAFIYGIRPPSDPKGLLLVLFKKTKFGRPTI